MPGAPRPRRTPTTSTQSGGTGGSGTSIPAAAPPEASLRKDLPVLEGSPRAKAAESARQAARGKTEAEFGDVRWNPANLIGQGPPKKLVPRDQQGAENFVETANQRVEDMLKDPKVQQRLGEGEKKPAPSKGGGKKESAQFETGQTLRPEVDTVGQSVADLPLGAKSVTRQAHSDTLAKKLLDIATEILEQDTSVELPEKRPLDTFSGIAAGVLAGIAPERFEQVKPILDEFQNEPINRALLQQEMEGKQLEQRGQKLQQLGQVAEIEAGARQAEHEEAAREQLAANAEALFQATGPIVEGYLEMSKGLMASENESDRMAGTQIRAQLTYLQQIQDQIAQNGVENITPEAFAEMKNTFAGLMGIGQKLQEQQAELEQALQLEKMQQSGAMARAIMMARARMAAMQKIPAGTKDQYLSRRMALAQTKKAIDLIKRNQAPSLMGGGPGGPIAGRASWLMSDAGIELDSLLATINVNFSVGEGGGGKALTVIETQIFGGRLALITDPTHIQLLKLESAENYLEKALIGQESLWPGIEGYISGLDLSKGLSTAIQVNETPIGSVPDDMLEELLAGGG